ncbi:hypothetical protein J7T55_012444 [Diaporthe amygdali]|uniref:uncharacterized protein n=1 Tax=Phomopsis amygdali TaxID=1214568 RepID=UPI0022FDCAA6|nr:uncharacterized protein J7T55_012444 [Diaporthe amygdali]KAJ0123971.1 hypothetical protein J7T55_012444 [Diaporthe amygdali]
MTQTKHQKTEVVSGHGGWYRNGDMGAGILFETDPLPEDSDPDLLHRPPSPRDHAANVWINPKLSTFPRFLTGSYEMERTTNPEQVVGGKRWSAKAHYGNTSAASGSGGLSKFPEPAGSAQSLIGKKDRKLLACVVEATTAGRGQVGIPGATPEAGMKEREEQ